MKCNERFHAGWNSFIIQLVAGRLSLSALPRARSSKLHLDGSLFYAESCDGAFAFVYLQLITLAIRFVLDSFLPVLCLFMSLFSFRLSSLSLFCNGMVESSERVDLQSNMISPM